MNEHEPLIKQPQNVFSVLFKGCLWLVGITLMLAVIGFVLLLSFNGNDLETEESRGKETQEEQQRRNEAVFKLKKSVEKYYYTNNVYPSTSTVHTVNDKQIQDYLKSNLIRYSTDPTGKECYVLQYIHAGGMGWSGTQFSNKPECIGLPKDAKPKSDGSFTNILDLH